MRSLILPNGSPSNPNQVQLFYSDAHAITIHYDNVNTVNVSVLGAANPIPVNVTDATDAATLIQQINNAIASGAENTAAVIASNSVLTAPTIAAAATSIITLSWAAIAGAVSYNIYIGLSSGGEGNSPSGSSPTNSFAFNGNFGQPYYFTVTAVNQFGRESAQSNEVTATVNVPLVFSSISPNTRNVGNGHFVATITGTGFLTLPQSRFYLKLNGADLATGGSGPVLPIDDNSYVFDFINAATGIIFPSAGTYNVFIEAVDTGLTIAAS